MSKVKERIKQERENLKKRVFSFTTFVELLTDYMNEPEFESHIMKMEDEETVAKIKTYPVKGFRKMLKQMLLKFGVAEKDAEKVMDEYKFKVKDVECMYDFMSDFMYQYLQTGRKLVIFDKEDMNVSIIADDVEENIKTHKATAAIPESTVHYDTHKKVSSSSKCPKWKKQTVEKDNHDKILKAIKQIYK